MRVFGMDSKNDNEVARRFVPKEKSVRYGSQKCVFVC